MKRPLLLTSVFLLAVIAIQAASPKSGAAPRRPVVPSAQTPDFWYVLPDGTAPSDASRSVRGIVVPSTVRPTFRTTPEGSVISWSRPDGTRQSFAVQGVSSFRFEPGPLEGTTYVPFGSRKKLSHSVDDCCTCASWPNYEESVEYLGCVPGCMGCGCEACICSPSFPCALAAPGDMVLSAHNGAGPTMKFGDSGATGGITLVSHAGGPVSFRGKRVAASLTATGETVINNPDAITLPGPVATSASIRGERALFAWSSPEASIILDQPRSMPPPSFRDGVIDFHPEPVGAPATAAKRLEVMPVMDECRVCGTHPNSQGDLDLMACVPGLYTCYRCVSFSCLAAGS